MAYGFYITTGVVLVIAGIVYLSSFTDPNSFAGAVCCGCGFIMAVIGGGAIYANLSKMWLIMRSFFSSTSQFLSCFWPP